MANIDVLDRAFGTSEPRQGNAEDVNRCVDSLPGVREISRSALRAERTPTPRRRVAHSQSSVSGEDRLARSCAIERYTDCDRVITKY